MDLQTQLVASFSDLKCEVEATMFSAQALQVAAFESTHALSADLKYLQVILKILLKGRLFLTYHRDSSLSFQWSCELHLFGMETVGR